LSHNSEVSVESLEDATEHSHEEDLEIANNKSTNFKWPDEATKIVKNNLHARPNQILRKLKDANVFSGNIPSKPQLYNKVAAERKSVFPSECVRNTHELRRKVAEFLKEPESDTEPYVPFHEIEDSDPSKEPRFTIIFASKKNLDKLKADRVLQTDATYRLNWMGYPVFVIGKRIFSI
jgi:hypothetical protein